MITFEALEELSGGEWLKHPLPPTAPLTFNLGLGHCLPCNTSSVLRKRAKEPCQRLHIIWCYLLFTIRDEIGKWQTNSKSDAFIL